MAFHIPSPSLFTREPPVEIAATKSTMDVQKEHTESERKETPLKRDGEGCASTKRLPHLAFCFSGASAERTVVDSKRARLKKTA